MHSYSISYDTYSVKIAMCQFVPNFLSYVSGRYYLNWFTVLKVITKIKRVNFLLRHNLHCFLDIAYLAEDMPNYHSLPTSVSPVKQH